ncbi:hypothetical protein FRX31_024741 [Thalictrum thalictroides]|uniref:Uncharacterized protein n=1 Tax=Thalictrum thalictroides TaxID=46969 RepID=A0A7J6VMV4_THATH|nr:hypothetical protein FRX31_024741 [Thalictrum thalictroides]
MILALCLQIIFLESEGDIEDTEHQPLSQRLPSSHSRSQMDRNDFDLTGVEIDLTQFDGVFLDNDDVADLAAMPLDEGVIRDIDSSHTDPSTSLIGEDLSRKRKTPEVETQIQSP